MLGDASFVTGVLATSKTFEVTTSFWILAREAASRSKGERELEELEIHYVNGGDGLEGVEIHTTDRLFPFSSARPARQEFLLVCPCSRDLAHIGPSVQPSPEFDALTEVLMLVARLKQRFAALLLVRECGGEYKRIASDYGIIAEVRDVNKLMDIRSIEIL
ncbi:hypothetical protein BJ138DRAFT_1106360 [Hygrophoropsis aurantiaca]|uniref:Uncharacterized protein n=1 Tax=Hygrophoropsis aurantiaca TaxID=72124 RepID=A0ACB7ZW66_9AGAM|nr:hypothetical protein BJ138DRAFT_1106360 [Hygrophoropsis aurantiaca]